VPSQVNGTCQKAQNVCILPLPPSPSPFSLSLPVLDDDDDDDTKVSPICFLIVSLWVVE